MTKEEVRIGMLVKFVPHPDNTYYRNALTNDYEPDDPVIGNTYVVGDIHTCKCGNTSVSIGIRSFTIEDDRWVERKELSCTNSVIVDDNDGHSVCPKTFINHGEMYYNINHFEPLGRTPLNIKLKI